MFLIIRRTPPCCPEGENKGDLLTIRTPTRKISEGAKTRGFLEYGLIALVGVTFRLPHTEGDYILGTITEIFAAPLGLEMLIVTHRR